MSNNRWDTWPQTPAKPFQPSDVRGTQNGVDLTLRASLERIHEKLDRILASIEKMGGNAAAHQPVPGVYGPGVEKEVG